MKIIGMVLASAIAFVGASSGAWWVKSHYLSSPEDVTVSEDADAQQTQGLPPPNADDRLLNESDQLPVAVRPKEVSVEEMLRLGMSLNEREKRIVAEEDKLKERSIQQQIAIGDITAERDEIDQMRNEIDDQLATAEQLMTRLIQGRQAIIDERTETERTLKEMEEIQSEFSEQQQKRIKQLAQLIQSMDAEKGAEVIREMSNDGKIRDAAEILSLIEERDAAKILEYMDDAKLVQDLVTEFKNLQTSEIPRSRR